MGKRVPDSQKNIPDLHIDGRIQDHVLVCLSSSPSNTRIIEAAARMAQGFQSDFTALYVQTPQSDHMKPEDQKRLQDNMNLAGHLGAKLETVYGDNVPYQIAEFARLSDVTKIVIGRSAAGKGYPWEGPSLTDRLIELTPHLEVHIIPDRDFNNHPPKSKQKNSLIEISFSLKETLFSITILALASFLGVIMHIQGLNESNIVTTYLLSVLIISIFTNGRIYSALASIATVFIFNFLFTEPKYTLVAYDQGYTITFIIMFVSAMIASTLATRLKLAAAQSAKAAHRTRILLEANQELGKKQDSNAIIDNLGHMLVRLSNKDIIIYMANDEKEGKIYRVKEPDVSVAPWDFMEEYEIAQWVMEHNKKAGATTEVFSKARGLYYALRVGDHIYGVVGIDMSGHSLDAYENSILLSIIGECALVLDNVRNQKEKEEANLLAQRETLRANLLRAISHDLRTPLTAIYGNANILIRNEDTIGEDKKKLLYEDIYEDSMWLTQLVENLLAITKIEEGRMHLNLQLELISDVIEEALEHIDAKKKDHQIIVEESESLAMVRMDAGLIVQVIVNLINNAIRYTQNGSKIVISTEERDGNVILSVADDGPGIADSDKEHIFEMFFTANQKVIDGRRSLGMGLALCKSIVLAHKGTICVKDSVPQGSTFIITLPVEEVHIFEKV